MLLPAALVTAVFVLAFGKAYVIPASSMEPTLHCAEPQPGCTASRSDRVLVLPFFGPLDPSRGDLVAFRTPPVVEERCGAGGKFVKRIVALPGETWRIENGVVYVDGRELEEPYVRPDRRGSDTRPGQRVPDEGYIVLGDNRVQSCDSRVWGSVSRDDLIGEVVAVYWPPNRMGFR